MGNRRMKARHGSSFDQRTTLLRIETSRSDNWRSASRSDGRCTRLLNQQTYQQCAAENQEPRTVQRLQLITLHEPTLDAIAGQRQQDASDISDDESIMDDYDLQGQQDGNTRRFQDGIVLYDSERIPNPPPQDPARTLRNIALLSSCATESQIAPRSPVPPHSCIAHATHAPAAAADSVDPPTRRGDRTASSNTLVDPSNARTVSGELARS